VSLAAPPPSPSVRVRTETLDRLLSTVGEVILHSSQVRTSAHAERRPRSGELAATLDRMERVVGDLQRRALELRTTPLLRILEPLPRAAREIAEKLGKKVEVLPAPSSTARSSIGSRIRSCTCCAMRSTTGSRIRPRARAPASPRSGASRSRRAASGT
jgi:hypothetical protein